jgi:hypothetical protein
MEFDAWTKTLPYTMDTINAETLTDASQMVGVEVNTEN